MSDNESWVKRGAELVRDFWRSVESDRRVWCLTTEQGVMPWEDNWGRVTLPLWGTHIAAVAQVKVALLEADFEPGDEETPLPFSVTELAGKLVKWSGDGVEVVFLNPVERRAPLTLTVAEFAAELERRCRPELTPQLRTPFDDLVRAAGRPRLP